MTRAEEAADVEIIALDDGPHGRLRPFEQGEQGKILPSPRLRLLHGDGRPWGGGFKAHPQEDKFPIWFLLRHIQAVHR